MAYIDDLYESGDLDWLKKELKYVEKIIIEQQARLLLENWYKREEISKNLEYEKEKKEKILEYISKLSARTSADLCNTFNLV